MSNTLNLDETFGEYEAEYDEEDDLDEGEDDDDEGYEYVSSGPAVAETNTSVERYWIRHNSQQFHEDETGFPKMYNAATKYISQRRADKLPERDEPGDMRQRGIWTFEPQSQMSWNAYSQMSCAVGMANVYDQRDMDRLTEIANKYGKPFLFTCVSSSLKQYAFSKPEKYKYLFSSESWMYRHKEVCTFVTIT